MDRREYEQEMAALRRDVPALLNDINEYVLLARLEGRTDAAERCLAMAQFVEEVFSDILNPFAPTFSDN